MAKPKLYENEIAANISAFVKYSKDKTLHEKMAILSSAFFSLVEEYCKEKSVSPPRFQTFMDISEEDLAQFQKYINTAIHGEDNIQ